MIAVLAFLWNIFEVLGFIFEIIAFLVEVVCTFADSFRSPSKWN